MILFSCHKQAVDIGPEYELLLGKWASVYSQKKSSFEFRDNGQVNLSYEGRRGKNFRVVKSKLGVGISLSGQNWDKIVFEVKNTDSSIEGVLMHATTKDTLMYGGVKYIRQ